ncbi:MAG: helix-turn-helix domain-containing protein [Chloroflexota bacterium]
MKYSEIEEWDDEDLRQLPGEETDFYEYKSSKIEIKSLKSKISVAASAFWNSGGGVLIAGVNNDGKIDGGIPLKIGRQSIRDWVDQAIASVEPPGHYVIKIITGENKVSNILDAHAVLVIRFEESYIGPHMAIDKKYYIRAGAHTGPASHFLVEAIRARRGLEKPLLVGLIRRHPSKTHSLELVILVANDAPAFDVELNLKPLPNVFQEYSKDRFPLKISAIDRQHPFSMEISPWGPNSKEIFGEGPVELQLEYKDIAGRKYNHNQSLGLNDGIGPMRFGDEPIDKIQKSLEKMHLEMKSFRHDFNGFVTEFQNADSQE